MEIVTKIAPIALALIMLGLGLGLTTQDFARVLKAPKDLTDKLYGRIHEETGVNMKPTRLDRIKSWYDNVTTGEKAYVSFWIIYLYLLLGLVITQEPRIVGMVAEIILWPLFM